MYFPSFPEAPTMQTLIMCAKPSGASSRFAASHGCRAQKSYSWVTQRCRAGGSAMDLSGVVSGGLMRDVQLAIDVEARASRKSSNFLKQLFFWRLHRSANGEGLLLRSL